MCVLGCAWKPSVIGGTGVDRVSGWKRLEASNRLWNWGCLPGRKLCEDQMVKMIVASQGKEIDWGRGALVVGRRLTSNAGICVDLIENV